LSLTSSTDIGNLALDLLSSGNVQDIDSPNNATEELVSRWYTLTRQRLLREHPWNFAIKRAQLAASSTSPAFGYDKQYPVPADFLRVLFINDDERITQSQYYRVENNHILTRNIFNDSSVLNITYVSDYTNVSGMDPLFVELLGYDLAMNIAYKVAESQSNVQRLAEIRKERAALAKTIDGQEDPPRIIERSRSLKVRRNNHANLDSHRIKF